MRKKRIAGKVKGYQESWPLLQAGKQQEKGEIGVEGLTLEGGAFSKGGTLNTGITRGVFLNPRHTPRPFTGESLGRDLALGFLKAPLFISMCSHS